jgi:hypothetical protein
MVGGGRCKKIVPKSCNRVELIVFLQNCLFIMQHGDFEKKKSAHKGFDLKTKEAKNFHFHPPCDVDKMWFSTQSIECGHSPLVIVHLQPKIGDISHPRLSSFHVVGSSVQALK